MDRLLFIPVIFISCLFSRAHAQEVTAAQNHSDTVGITPTMEFMLPAGLDLAPLEFEAIDIPLEKIKYDNSEIRGMHRKVLSEIPRYPTMRLGGNLSAYPFLMSSRSRYMGLDMAGIGTRVDITEWLSADISTYLSSAYIGMQYPGSYLNASVATTLRVKVHDRIYLLGMAEGSAREGLHPKVAPGLGGKNALGAGVEFWITDKIGISVTRTWEYYRGSWYGHNGFAPVGR